MDVNNNKNLNQHLYVEIYQMKKYKKSEFPVQSKAPEFH